MATPYNGNCEIRRAGVRDDGRVVLDLKSADNTFDWHWFLAKPEISHEILAVALSAIACNKLVYCITEDIVDWSNVTWLAACK